MDNLHLYFLTLFLLLGWHGLADFPLQGQFMSDAKNPNHPIGTDKWRIVLSLHVCIHGIGVTLITGSLVLGLLETLIHGRVDYLRCKGRITFERDQFMHVGCKIAWALLSVFVIH
jgi:hypothetical protein